MLTVIMTTISGLVKHLQRPVSSKRCGNETLKFRFYHKQHNQKMKTCLSVPFLAKAMWSMLFKKYVQGLVSYVLVTQTQTVSLMVSVRGGRVEDSSIMTINEQATQPSAQRDIRPDTPPTLQFLIGVTRVSSYYLLPQSVDASFILTGSLCRIYPFPLHSAAGRTQLTLKTKTNYLLDRKQVKKTYF